MKNTDICSVTSETRSHLLPEALVLVLALVSLGAVAAAGQDHPVVDTGQSGCYDDLGDSIACPAPGEAFHGQDAQHEARPAQYVDNGDGTVSDEVTGLMWQQTPAWGLTYAAAVAGASSITTGGHDDWRLPTLKELYSLIDFDGVTGTSAALSTPYVDTAFFDFEYGDPAAGERFIDAQYCTGTEYVWTTMNGDETVFGVNFADGRIKGYGIEMPDGSEKTFDVRYVRGGVGYGVNDLLDNGGGTVSGRATGLMWTRADSGFGMSWEEALAWVAERNAESYLGHADWRLPEAKELQGLVDYTRSPDTHGAAAIDPVFLTTAITNEGGAVDYPFFWTSTTHLDGPPDIRGSFAVYVAFGRALGWMESPPDSGNYQLLDVHGAGAQRGDPKSGDPASWPNGNGPQGDVVRIDNYVRLVRDTGSTPFSPSDLAATGLSVTEIELSWLDNSDDEEEFRIEMRIGDGEFEDIDSVAAGATGVVVDSLQPGTGHTFRIRARNGAGDSAYSNEASATTLAGPGCVPNDQILCLGGGRFRVEIRWRDFIDQEGLAGVVEVGSDDSGLFFFFDPDNWEMLLKVLDGCGFNGHYWVFAAATTNVEYTLRVTDTQTGELREYFNPLGTASPAITDTGAFATCP